MPDLKGTENRYLVLAFLVPGLVITFVRAQLLTGRLRSVQDNAVAYLGRCRRSTSSINSSRLRRSRSTRPIPRGNQRNPTRARA